ncbi:MAG: hypothetical protein DCF13_01910 [Flavobacteriaceae bacterium]|nr:MAG: hypothetical protein DCF13_01910 [Flavobacteriaceae bacterium]
MKIDFNNLPADPKTSHKIIEKSFEAEVHERELGKLGKFFGSGDTVKMNIAGITILILLVIGVSYTVAALLCDEKNSKAVGIIDFWGILTPIITLSLGFIFGKSQK